MHYHYPKGILKDKVKLITFLNIDRRREADFVNYLDEAVNEAGNNRFKTALAAFKAANESGADAFPFELSDRDGKVCKLTDFKGRMIMMVFWFSGCSGCLQMAKILKPIISTYKTNPDIVFISVSIDRNKDSWYKSLANALYCSQDEVNLRAERGRESSIINHYNIDAFPTLIAISKDGKINSTAPPDPRYNETAFRTAIISRIYHRFGNQENHYEIFS